MRPQARLRGRLAYPLVCCCVLLLAAEASAGGLTTYRYEEDDGTVWFTDHRPRGVNVARFRFLGYHGRPTATASCNRVTPDILAARAAAYRHHIDRLSRDFGVSPKLVDAIITVESCFDRMARSSAGAQGLMQLMPQTARALGVDNVFDPEQNLRGGIQYFSRLQRRYANNNRLALAAYNAGPAAVERFNGVPPFRETLRYVDKVLAKYREYLQR